MWFCFVSAHKGRVFFLYMQVLPQFFVLRIQLFAFVCCCSNKSSRTIIRLQLKTVAQQLLRNYVECGMFIMRDIIPRYQQVLRNCVECSMFIVRDFIRAIAPSPAEQCVWQGRKAFAAHSSLLIPHSSLVHYEINLRGSAAFHADFFAEPLFCAFVIDVEIVVQA